MAYKKYIMKCKHRGTESDIQMRFATEAERDKKKQELIKTNKYVNFQYSED